MPDAVAGIHHITAIAGDPQQNLDFYTGFLGLRLVKRTVNFDDPGTYHLYYGDAAGTPGTILTFFPWPGARRGRSGTGEVTAVKFSVPAASLDFWAARAGQYQAAAPGPAGVRLEGERFLSLKDPDGLSIELVGDESAAAGWGPSSVPERHTIRGFHSATLTLREAGPTAALLTGPFGFRPVAEHENLCRYASGAAGAGTLVDVVSDSGAARGRIGAGSVHHIAWRAPDDDAERRWREVLINLGYDVTPVMGRQYFNSIYFREPGGVLFEIATDPPGFTLDETPDTLGEALKLPPWLEPRRGEIERALPAIVPPGARRT